MKLNKLGYDPFHLSGENGYRRPPRDPAAVCDYFHALSFIEDEGEFMHSEMAEMMDRPETFFSPEESIT